MERKLRIGFVSVWFERGQAYVTKAIRDALEGPHETHVLARTGQVYGAPMLERKGSWDVPNLTTCPGQKIALGTVAEWIRDRRLDMVVFNEEYDWELVQFCKKQGVRVLTYLDYYEHGWKDRMALYDAVLCSTRRTFELVRSVCNAYYIGWAVDAALFCPRSNGEEKHTFFHNAGWLGINYRKMTPAVIAAFDIVSKILPDCSLLVHAQAGKEKLPGGVLEILEKNPRIEYYVGTVPAPGLYHRSRILVFPSKLEGLGLPLLEGLSCGLPAVATDAPPMNEFVRDGENGLLVPVSRVTARADGLAFEENIVEVRHLALKMAQLALHPEQVEAMSEKARQFALERLGPERFRERLLEIISSVAEMDRPDSELEVIPHPSGKLSACSEFMKINPTRGLTP